jgi:hypothetical protein
MSDTKDIELKRPSYLANLNPIDNELPVQQEDIRVPSIVIAQPAGSALKEDDPAYIDGLKAGQFYNGQDRSVYGKTLRVQFIHYFKVFNVFKGTPQNPEWQEALPESEFLRLKSRVFQDHGIMTPDKPDCFIKETWRFVVALPSDEAIDFAFLNVKPGGISDAKAWVNAMYTRFKKGEDVLSLIWEMNTYSKESKTANASSYQIEGSKIKVVGYVEQDQYEKAVRIRDQIKKSQASLLGADGDY